MAATGAGAHRRSPPPLDFSAPAGPLSGPVRQGPVSPPDLLFQHGEEHRRLDAPADSRQKTILKNLSPDQVAASTLAGDTIVDKQTRAPGNQAALGGLKVVTAEGWFAARPSGTEDIYKIYAESFCGIDHLRRIQAEAKALITRLLTATG